MGVEQQGPTGNLALMISDFSWDMGSPFNCVFFVIERKISTSLSQLMKRGLQGQGSDLGRRIQDFTDL